MPEDDLNSSLAALRRLSLRTKALVISSEFTRKQMDSQGLRVVLHLLAPEQEERSKIANAVEEELRAARYPSDEIVRLLGELLAPPAASKEPVAPPPAAQNINVTRKVRSPTLMPFERISFHASPPMPPDFKVSRGGESLAPPPAAGPMSRARSAGGLASVLVADDDSRARLMYRAKLEEAGYNVIEARDGFDAWRQISDGGPRCVVMDMKMPGYHGLEVLSRMVDSGRTLPVVVVSAFDQLENEFVVSTYPKLRFLTKPAAPEKVLEAVAGFLPIQ